MMNIGLILSGGIGQRMNSQIPKQYLKCQEKMMITYSLETVYKHKQIDAVWIVAENIWRDKIEEEQRGFSEKFKGFSDPGKNRQLSILNGLRDISAFASADDVVMIHDAVRPFLAEKQISDGLNAIKNHDGVVPVLSIKDTVYYSKDGKKISELVKRNQIFAGQAPEFFRLAKYLKATEDLLPDKILRITGTTEVAIMAGLDVIMIPGDENNFKITTPKDLENYHRQIKERKNVF